MISTYLVRELILFSDMSSNDPSSDIDIVVGVNVGQGSQEDQQQLHFEVSKGEYVRDLRFRVIY